MASSLIVGSEAIRVSNEYVFDPVNGPSTRETWKGSEGALTSLAAAFQLAGHRATVQNEGGRWSMTVDIGGVNRSGDPEGSETPTDKWQLRRDYIQETLWGNAKIVKHCAAQAAETVLAGGSETTEGHMAYLRLVCESALKGLRYSTTTTKYDDDQYAPGPLKPSQFDIGTSTPSGSTFSDADVYKLLLLGTEAYETERLSITRHRTYSAVYAGRISVDSVPIIYTTAQLKAAFAVPDVIYVRLPGFPGGGGYSANPDPSAAPNKTLWGWRVRNVDASVMFSGKVEEVIEFTYAAWSTVLYRVSGESIP